MEKIVIELGGLYELRCGTKVVLKDYTSCFTYDGNFYQSVFADVVDGADLLPEREREQIEYQDPIVVVSSPLNGGPLDIVRRLDSEE